MLLAVALAAQLPLLALVWRAHQARGGGPESHLAKLASHAPAAFFYTVLAVFILAASIRFGRWAAAVAAGVAIAAACLPPLIADAVQAQDAKALVAGDHAPGVPDRAPLGVVLLSTGPAHNGRCNSLCLTLLLRNQAKAVTIVSGMTDITYSLAPAGGCSRWSDASLTSLNDQRALLAQIPSESCLRIDVGGAAAADTVVQLGPVDDVGSAPALTPGRFAPATMRTRPIFPYLNTKPDARRLVVLRCQGADCRELLRRTQIRPRPNDLPMRLTPPDDRWPGPLSDGPAAMNESVEAMTSALAQATGLDLRAPPMPQHAEMRARAMVLLRAWTAQHYQPSFIEQLPVGQALEGVSREGALAAEDEALIRLALRSRLNMFPEPGAAIGEHVALFTDDLMAAFRAALADERMGMARSALSALSRLPEPQRGRLRPILLTLLSSRWQSSRCATDFVRFTWPKGLGPPPVDGRLPRTCVAPKHEGKDLPFFRRFD